MPTFQPSKYSPKSNPEESAQAVEVTDPQGGLFGVEWGKITYLGKGPPNYPAVNTVWAKGVDSAYAEMIGNLSTASSTNKTKIESILGPEEVKAAEAAAYQAAALVPEVSAGDSALPAGGDPGGKVPLTQQPWFWPVVIIGVAGVAGFGIWYKRKGAGAEMEIGDAVPA